jgi:hypothetical protein
MHHITPAHRLALLVAALSLAGPNGAGGQTADDGYLRLLTADELSEINNSPERIRAFFANNSLLEISWEDLDDNDQIVARSAFVEIRNNTV